METKSQRRSDKIKKWGKKTQQWSFIKNNAVSTTSENLTKIEKENKLFTPTDCLGSNDMNCK